MILYLKVPIAMPALMVLMSAYLVVAPIIDQPSMEYLYCVIFIFSGLILYFIFIYLKVKWARKVTGKHFQQLTNSGEGEWCHVCTSSDAMLLSNVCLHCRTDHHLPAADDGGGST